MRGEAYIFDAAPDLSLQTVQLVRQRAKAHRVQQQAPLAGSSACSARAGVAGSPCPSAPGNAMTGVALEGNLLLLSEDLDLGGGKAKRGVGDGGDGHLVPAETCSDQSRRRSRMGGRTDRRSWWRRR